MIKGISKIYKDMIAHSIGYPVLHSEGKIEVWESQERKKKIYIITQQDDRFNVSDGYNTIANQMSAINTIQFMKLDMEINTKISTNTFKMADMSKEPSVITNMSQLNKFKPKTTSDGGFIQGLMTKQKVIKAACSGTVKSKRKFDLDDLDLDED